ncbi:MAG TPA: HAD family hydrolase [Desulfobacterales bacterium]|nr:HAD family hydrolase [Desulfobacterales bacterium]
MKTAVLFDLDDTLYPEIEFVKSGFRAAARYLSSRYHFGEDSLVKQMLNILRRDGRGKIFDTLLHQLGLYTEEKVRLLVYLYRSHRPTIHLYEDVLPTLECLRRYGTRLGIITDGMASVQRNKIAALGLNNLFDVIVCTDELGKDCWKPSTIPYKIALELLEARPSEAVYVGDDPSKDFLAPNSIGMLTVQVNRQTYQNLKQESIPKVAAARFVIKGLKQILPIIRGENNVC